MSNLSSQTIGITDKGKISLLEYEAKRYKAIIMALSLTAISLATTLTFLALH